ncbi:MAG: glucoamylase family protein, partial [Gallionellaceae bacterium]|nr:glucoamylase family protein [Gallionellaceae bacterium]
MNTKAIHRQLLLLKTLITGHSTPRYNTADESPLRAELFSADQMEQHGKHLATLHKLTQGHASDQLLSRLSANEEVLVGVCRLLTTAVTANTRISPAEEWLLDNFYLIEEQIRTAKRHLPKGYSRELPRLLHGPSAGLPRVYDIALEIISYGDGRVDVDSLTRFVASYQTLTALKLGELWAIPIMLRLALIENLRRVAACISLSRMNQELAIFWANKMMEVAKKDPKSLILVIADMARSKPPMVSSFVAELVRRLQGQSSALALPLTWIEQWLSEANLTIEQLIQSEAQRQAADQVSIGNSIGSLRLLTTTDWRDFVETLSVVEQTLGRDPAGIYLRMDFATRDRYRHEVERIAKRAGLAEGEVAQAAMQLAGSATARSVPGNNGDTRTTHIGYYLIDQGVSQLEQAVKLQRPPLFRLQRLFSRYPLAPYLGVILLLTLAFTAELLSRADSDGLQGWRLLSAALLLLLASSQLAIGLVNWLATLLTTPHSLPRMDFSLGIPAQSRTLVVIPTMLTSTQNIEELVEALEVRFLGNRDDNLHFGLLTDWRDASEETMAEDETLLQFAAHRIGELNNKYRSADPVATSDNRASSFFLFHRPRLWNPQEHLWMGYERKRGKLADLNAFLRGNKQRNGKNRFALIVGNTGTPGEAGILAEVRYVITLDTDTQLPRESAQQFVATMAHPLNRPLCDQQKRCVSAGYGILQPSVRVSLTGDYASHYERLWGSELGIDPYTRAVSDVYQDIFAEGSFIGKGIYEVDAFEWALNDRFPENRILSHDLLEGCYARCGLLSDSHLYEDYPARYSMDVSRRHRWIRGDWQLLSWLRRKVPGAGGQYEKNPLSMLSQWKIFDNLRRSLTSTALCLLLLLGWTVLSRTLPSVWFWTGAVVGIILLPSLSAFVMDLFRKPAEVLLRQHLAAEMRSAGKYVAQATLTLICLPFDAYISLDAIVRSLWRMLWSRKRLLEWNPASNLDAVSSCRFGINRTDLSAAVQLMWVASLFALLIALYLSTKNPDALTVAFPILALWFFSPLIMWWMSRPVSRDEAMLSAVQITFLRKISRKTWAFFETFVSAADNWLPPDNYQEYRGVSVAHRTSPTNIGLALLSNLSAYDFAYIPAGPLLERTAHTLNTMQKLQRYQGHFYNWYDTLSLQPLHPLYISSVDSGNLASNLLILRSGLHGLIDAPIVSKRVFEGLQDTLELLADGGKNITLPLLKIFRQNLEAACASPPATLSGVHVVLERLTKQILRFTASLDNQPKADVAGGDVPFWAHTLARQCQAALDELMFLAPWLELSPAPADLDDLLALDSIPSLSELVQLEKTMLPIIKQHRYAADDLEQHRWLEKWQLALADGSRRARERMQLIEHLVTQVSAFAHMEYDFLYDKKRHLLAIGYNADERRRDTSFYDLLASEARLCVFVAIAQGQLPQESWFALGRTLTSTGGEPTLISWSGSMFEYLMPLLIMPTFGNTLIDQTYRAAVQRQIEYGKQCGVPWGISECGYNVVDGHFNYQYRAFGVPGLGLKRGLADDLVIAPYASALALTVAPEAACHNLQRLA